MSGLTLSARPRKRRPALDQLRELDARFRGHDTGRVALSRPANTALRKLSAAPRRRAEIARRRSAAHAIVHELQLRREPTCGGVNSSPCSAEHPRGRSPRARSRASACGASACSCPQPRTIRNIRPASRRSCRRWRNWAGPTAATCGSTPTGPRPMPPKFADTRRNWPRSRRMSSWPRHLDRGADAAGDPHRADRVPDRHRSGRRRLRRQPGAAGRQRHRFHDCSNTA